MTNYRDPKVTETSDSSGLGKWIAIAVALIVAIAAIAWLMGAFSGDEAETVPIVTEQEAPADTTTPEPVVTEPDAPAITTTPEATAPAQESPGSEPAGSEPTTGTDPAPIAPVAQ